MSGCDFIVEYIVHILKPEASKIHKTHFKSDLSFSLFPLLMSRIYILFVAYILLTIFSVYNSPTRGKFPPWINSH